MCRWMAYSGEPILAEELLFRPTHSIIDQSLHAKLQGYTTNGDGFGIGWYGDSTTPAVYKSTHPAWNDRDLHEIAGQIRTPLLVKIMPSRLRICDLFWLSATPLALPK